eukprot:296408_1
MSHNEHIQTNIIKITLNIAKREIDEIYNLFFSSQFNPDEFLKHLNSASKMRFPKAQIDGYMIAVYPELIQHKNKLIALIDRTSDEWKIIKLFYTKLSTKKMIVPHMESTIELLKHDSSYANFIVTWLFDNMGLRNIQSSEQQASLHIEEEVIRTDDETKYDNEAQNEKHSCGIDNSVPMLTHVPKLQTIIEEDTKEMDTLSDVNHTHVNNFDILHLLLVQLHKEMEKVHCFSGTIDEISNYIKQLKCFSDFDENTKWKEKFPQIYIKRNNDIKFEDTKHITKALVYIPNKLINCIIKETKIPIRGDFIRSFMNIYFKIVLSYCIVSHRKVIDIGFVHIKNGAKLYCEIIKQKYGRFEYILKPELIALSPAAESAHVDSALKCHGKQIGDIKMDLEKLKCALMKCNFRTIPAFLRKNTK